MGGIGRSGGVVTSAAVIMVAVFSIFATLSFIEFKQMGVGLAAAVLIDATLIRGVLMPVGMRVLGRAAWWAPGFLRRVHGRVGLREADDESELVRA